MHTTAIYLFEYNKYIPNTLGLHRTGLIAELRETHDEVYPNPLSHIQSTTVGIDSTAALNAAVEAVRVAVAAASRPFGVAPAEIDTRGV